jgi:hypothetical protein
MLNSVKRVELWRDIRRGLLDEVIVKEESCSSHERNRKMTTHNRVLVYGIN